MGVNFSAYSVIGCLIERIRLFKQVKRKAFDHDYDEDVNFCPQTGKMLWVEEHVPINGQDEIVDVFGEFDVCDESSMYPTDYVFVGRATIASYETPEKQDPKDLNFSAIRNELKTYLSSFGIWDENTFGLWTFVHVG